MSPSDPARAIEDPDAEADSEAGDQALPLVDETANPALAQDRTRLEARLNDAQLRKRIVRYLLARHGMSEEDADDVTNDAMMRALRANVWPPENVPIYPWLRRYANFQRLKFQSASARRESREEYDEQIEDRPLEKAPEDDRAAHVARIASEVGAESAQNASALEMWKARADGVPIVSIAVESDIGEEAAKKRMQRFANTVRERWAEVSAGAIAVCAAILLYLHTLVPQPVPTPVAVVPPPRPLPTLPAPLTAQAIRTEGVRRCNAAKTTDDWDACRAWLDRAKDMDPDGDAAPAIQKLRARAHQVLEGKTPPPTP